MSAKITKAPPQDAVDRLMKIANAGVEWHPMSTKKLAKKFRVSTQVMTIRILQELAP